MSPVMERIQKVVWAMRFRCRSIFTDDTYPAIAIITSGNMSEGNKERALRVYENKCAKGYRAYIVSSSWESEDLFWKVRNVEDYYVFSDSFVDLIEFLWRRDVRRAIFIGSDFNYKALEIIGIEIEH